MNFSKQAADLAKGHDLVARLVEVYRAEGREAASELFARGAKGLKAWEVRVVREQFQREIGQK